VRARIEARRGATPVLALVVLVAAAVRASPDQSLAEPGEVSSGSTAAAAPERPSPGPLSLPPRGRYTHPFGAIALGRGMRFNNPYRLRTQLGETAESLSLSASYLDLSAGLAFGDPLRLQHGAVLHFSQALQGIAQEVITSGYALLFRLPPRWLLLGRIGVPLVLRPDASWGLEAATGGVCYATAGIGLTVELVASLFYGAATWQRSVTATPMLSLQLGGFVDYEVLP
jgi:hypothetical protein